MIENKKILILGMARSGYEVAKLLGKANNTIIITDQKDQNQEQIDELKALGITSGSNNSNSATSNNTDLNLLSRIIYGEARGEPYEGQVAVGAVVLNRVRSSSFPNTIAGVIYQKGQFSCVTDGQFDVPIAEDSTVYKAAQDAMNGVDPTNGALYFYNPSKTKSKWLFSLKTLTTIGKHVFAVEE